MKSWQSWLTSMHCVKSVWWLTKSWLTPIHCIGHSQNFTVWTHTNSLCYLHKFTVWNQHDDSLRADAHLTHTNLHCMQSLHSYGVASVSRIDKIIRLFCKRALLKRRYSAKETCNLIDPANRSHPITFGICYQTKCMWGNTRDSTHDSAWRRQQTPTQFYYIKSTFLFFWAYDITILPMFLVYDIIRVYGFTIFECWHHNIAEWLIYI